MSERWVLNASPLIALARAGYADLIFSLAERALIPSAVALEIQAGPFNDPANQVLNSGKLKL